MESVGFLRFLARGGGVVDRFGRPYSRAAAAYPLPWLKQRKFWPTVGRVDDGTWSGDLGEFADGLILFAAYGDVNLVVSLLG